jgi:hypothetical protein
MEILYVFIGVMVIKSSRYQGAQFLSSSSYQLSLEKMSYN